MTLFEIEGDSDEGEEGEDSNEMSVDTPQTETPLLSLNVFSITQNHQTMRATGVHNRNPI